MELSTETLNVMLLLVPGFIAFRIYKIDANWSAISPIDVAYGSLIFSLAGYVALDALRGYVDMPKVLQPYGSSIYIAAALVIASMLGLGWRMWGHSKFHKALQLLKITNEDNQGDVWQNIFNQPRTQITQIYAYLKNGEAIGCDDTSLFARKELWDRRIFPYYTHNDRQMCFAANVRRINGIWTKIPYVDAGDEWGLRLVYFNPDEIQRVEVRIAPVPKQSSRWRRLASWAAFRGEVRAEAEGPSPSVDVEA